MSCMLITHSDTSNFSAKNKTIRMADDLARKVANTFAYPSTSKMLKLKRMSYEKYKELSAQTKNFRKAMADNLENKHTDFSKINTAIKTIKEKHFANCLELSFITFLYAKCRGISGCGIKYLFTKSEFLDHSVVYVSGKKPYIIDPWLGFADYVPKAIERYNSEFRKFLGFERKDYRKNIMFMDEMLVNSTLGELLNGIKTDDLPKNLIKKLQKHYPEFFAEHKTKTSGQFFRHFADTVRRLFRKENSLFLSN